METCGRDYNFRERPDGAAALEGNLARIGLPGCDFEGCGFEENGCEGSDFWGSDFEGRSTWNEEKIDELVSKNHGGRSPGRRGFWHRFYQGSPSGHFPKMKMTCLLFDYCCCCLIKVIVVAEVVVVEAPVDAAVAVDVVAA